jgi:mono/diheme cytochrome c family protein
MMWGLLSVCSLGLAGGCGPAPQTVFSWRTETASLIPEAQAAVKATIEESFGTPNQLVAWERFPVAYGGVKTEVVAPAQGEPPLSATSVKISVPAEAPEFQPGDVVIWRTGKASESPDPTATVVSYVPQTQRLVLKSTQSHEPTAGDELSIGFGKTLQLGRVVYMKNCHHCHGVAGDGQGPTAKYLNPKPRDYRDGVYKFTSTLPGVKASREDLKQIVLDGIPGTYMPSFLLLGKAETDAVVEYVRWLSMRGELEKALTAELSSDFSRKTLQDEYDSELKEYEAAVSAGEQMDAPKSMAERLTKAKDDFAEFAPDYADAVDGAADGIAEIWAMGDEPDAVIVPSVPRVPDDAASRERGRLIYLSDQGKCYTCHGVQGKGDGAAAEDFWKKPGSSENYPVRGLHDMWGNLLPPRDLTRGQYRGGRRPVDVFRRIHAGIKGTPMPAFGGTVLKDEQIWDVVNYTMSLPFAGSSAAPAPAPQTARRGESMDDATAK